MRVSSFGKVLFAILVLNSFGHASAADVNSERMAQAEQDPSEWLAHGRTYSEQRFSPLNQISDENVEQLGLAWSYELPTRRGQEATPLVIDGVMYLSGSWSQVFALDAKTGEQLWAFDPQVPRAWARYACCDVVNRGVAVWEGKVFVGSLDGRLIALNANTGERLWEVQTTDKAKAYTITGAPRVVKGKVFIGNGGGEYGVRGYVGAYDADTGELLWRFYTVPGNPDLGFENAAMEMAAKTWNGEWWKLGGGGTAWDSMAYDPELDLLYVGVGNGSPWNRDQRSPGGGDNLFLSSIVALKPDTGEYVWHYQTTPAEKWDYTATQHMILADIELDGVLRKVIMQAPKNGFFYVIDRETGEFLSAKNYVPVTWASHVNPETGRPVETINNDYNETAQIVLPSPVGGHNWMPMAFSPLTELVYIPAIDLPHTYAGDPQYPHIGADWQTGTNPSYAATPKEIGPDVERALLKKLAQARLIAWNPKTQTSAWSVEHKHPWNGGVLATGGNLVFQGDALGFFSAYTADTGTLLWQQAANTGIVAAPISYSIDGEQYVAVLAGWGGSMALFGGEANRLAQGGVTGRMLVYKLGANGLAPAGFAVQERELPTSKSLEGVTQAQLTNGFDLYNAHCMVCHGFGVVGGGLIPDLRYVNDATYQIFERIVGEGLLAPVGMPSFAGRLGEQEILNIKAYVTREAMREREDRNDPDWWRATKQTLGMAVAWLLTSL